MKKFVAVAGNIGVGKSTLVEKLCDAVRYVGEGNEVEAVFSWRSDV